MKRKALFVGVNDYEQITNLRCCLQDASALFGLFSGIGFETLLLDNPEEGEFKKEFSSFTKDLGIGDSFVFYFAGHGFTRKSSGEQVFAFKDSCVEDIELNQGGITFNYIESKTCRKGHEYDRVFILDACRSDLQVAVRGTDVGERDLTPSIGSLMSWIGGKHSSSNVSSCVFRACRKGQCAQEVLKKRHGLFTLSIIDVVQEAMSARRMVTFGPSFHRAVCAKMEEKKAEFKLPHDQVAEFKTDGTAEMVILDGDAPRSPDSVISTFTCAICRRKLAMAQYDKGECCCSDCAAERRKPKAGSVRTLVLPGGEGMEMVYCVPGEFKMGSPVDELGRDDDEDQHHVRLTKGFWLGRCPVTQGQWQSVMGSNPSKFVGERLPVDSVSWDDCREFIGKVADEVLLQLDGEARFPTEAEWEYACRAGTTTAYSWGDCLNGDKANCNGNYPYGMKEIGANYKKSTPVGCYGANAWGLCDLHGNVWEWCADWYGEYGGDAVDPTGPTSGTARVLRGGSWCSHAQECRSACRSKGGADKARDRYGFRLCCSVST